MATGTVWPLENPAHRQAAKNAKKTLGLLAPNPRPASVRPARVDYAVTSQRDVVPLHSQGFVCAVRKQLANRANETPLPEGCRGNHFHTARRGIVPLGGTKPDRVWAAPKTA